MILVDTTYIVDLIRKKVKIDSELDEEILFTTEITVFELYFGLYGNNILNKDPEKLQKRIDTLSKILTKFQILPFSGDESIQSAKILGQLKLDGKIIEFRDGMIAGSGLANGITKILTRNADHFDRIPGIQAITYELH
jgi:tRNA(fMet)-specific endonuclease VapC